MSLVTVGTLVGMPLTVVLDIKHETATKGLARVWNPYVAVFVFFVASLVSRKGGPPGFLRFPSLWELPKVAIVAMDSTSKSINFLIWGNSTSQVPPRSPFKGPFPTCQGWKLIGRDQ